MSGATCLTVCGDFRSAAGSLGTGLCSRCVAQAIGVAMTVSEEFASVTGGFRGELLALCYRMLGSAEEAEDLVQETYLRAWRSYAGFESRSSMRTWLAVVTGASRWFGRGIALTRAGAQVVGVARDHPQLIDAPERDVLSIADDPRQPPAPGA